MIPENLKNVTGRRLTGERRQKWGKDCWLHLEKLGDSFKNLVNLQHQFLTSVKEVCASSGDMTLGELGAYNGI